VSQTPAPGLGYADQARKRTIFRVLGGVAMTAALVLIGVAVADFFAAFSSDDFAAQPTKFWLFFLALPLFVVGAACLNAGFLGAAARYGAGETAPVLKDTASYLTDGEGLLGVGRTVDDERPSAAARSCGTCGTRAAADARFCATCGTSLA
jgi:hypothetical protein